jgi:pimeloyl-ACP methyl ester carboxylesterase
MTTRYPALAPLHPAIPAADGLVLRGHLVYPHGKTGSSYPLAVLAHQYPSTRDSYAPLCADLHALGIATLAFDLRGHGESTTSPKGRVVAPTPAEPTMDAFGAAFVASAGEVGFPHIADDIVRVASWGLFQNFIDSSRLLLVGASVGGTGVLLAAPRLTKALRGVVTFGAAGAPVHGPDATDRIRANCRSVQVPMLLTASEEDPFDGSNNARTWREGLGHVAAEIVPGKDHAMAIYYQVRTKVRSFVGKAMGLRASRPGASRKQARRR